MFTLSGKLYHFCEKLTNLICLNGLFIVFSLPVITAGGALSALMNTVLQSEKSFFSTFIQSFKQNVFKSLLIMVFSVFSYLFIVQFGYLIGGLPLAHIVYLLVLSLLISYNLNCYLLVNFLEARGLGFFRQAFYFTLGTFHKTFFFSIIGSGMLFLLSFILGIFMFLILFSGLVLLYVKLVNKELETILDDRKQKLA